MRTVRDRLEDVQEAIARIEQEQLRGPDAFVSDPKTQVWMIYHIQINGEAIRAVIDHLKELEPEIPWSQIVGMRHILVHDYFASISTKSGRLWKLTFRSSKLPY